MACQEKLLKSILSAHTAVVAYANCICEEIPEEEQEVFFKFGLELSIQLQELRKMYVRLYQVDPLSSYRPLRVDYCKTENK